MSVSFHRLILYVQDISLLSAFYQLHFDFVPTETIPGEWAVLRAGNMELALHRAGEAFRQQASAEGDQSNSKMVFLITEDLARFRQRLADKGVHMRDLKSYPGFDYRLCDGLDPEGNVFQLMEHMPAMI